MIRFALIPFLFACAACPGIQTLAAEDNTPPPPALTPPVDTNEVSRSELTEPVVKPNAQGVSDPLHSDLPHSDPLHDPTRPSPIMKQLIGPIKLPGQAKAPEIPDIELKSRIIGGLQAGVAVLGVDKQIYVVSKGSEFTLAGPKYGGQKVHVMELDADVVRLEIQPTNLSVTLR